MIRTEYVPMPRAWCAYDDDNERGPIGWGETEAEALADYQDQIDE